MSEKSTSEVTYQLFIRDKSHVELLFVGDDDDELSRVIFGEGGVEKLADFIIRNMKDWKEGKLHGIGVKQE